MMAFRLWRSRALREELDEHLDAINEGYRDVADVRDNVALLDEKIEKLAARLDELYLLLGADAAFNATENRLLEFLQTPRSIAAVASVIGDTEACAARVLRSLHLKGARVYVVTHGVETLFTLNKESTLNLSLDSYF